MEKASQFSTVRDLIDEEFLVSLLLGASIGILAFLWMRRNRNLPPGPIGLPIVGYLPFLGKKAYLKFHQLTLKYGPVYSLRLGTKLVVVLGSFKTVKEALTNNSILARPEHPPNHLLPDSSSFTVSSGAVWKEQRQFAVQLLRQLGMGKSKVEEIIQEEMVHLLKLIHSKNGQPFNLDKILMPSVSNNIYTLLLGHRLEFGHKDRKLLDRMLSIMVLYFRPTRIHAYFPWLRKWFIKLKIWGYHNADDVMIDFGKFIDEKVEEHKKTLERQHTRDFVDGYLFHMMNKDNSVPSFSHKMLRGTILSLLGAGSTPARATVEWALVAMVYYPEIQKRVHAEIDSVVGRDRLPQWSDSKLMPYTMAVVLEVMRSNTIIPIGMLRSTSENCKIRGYDIPKGTIVLTNLWGVHHNTDYWDDPFTFKPERFLDNGKVIKPMGFVPFSYGKRNCPGEDFANVAAFLYFTSLLQSFTISLPPEALGKFGEMLGIANLPVPDNICLTKRN